VGFKKYAIEMFSVAVIYTPTFIKTGSRIQKFIGGDTKTHGYTDRSHKLILGKEAKKNK
jgi:hypothetical protein